MTPSVARGRVRQKTPARRSHIGRVVVVEDGAAVEVRAAARTAPNGPSSSRAKISTLASTAKRFASVCSSWKRDPQTLTHPLERGKTEPERDDGREERDDRTCGRWDTELGGVARRERDDDHHDAEEHRADRRDEHAGEREEPRDFAASAAARRPA